MSNPLSSSSVNRFCCSRINFQTSCVLLIYKLVSLSCGPLVYTQLNGGLVWCGAGTYGLFELC